QLQAERDVRAVDDDVEADGDAVLGCRDLAVLDGVLMVDVRACGAGERIDGLRQYEIDEVLMRLAAFFGDGSAGPCSRHNRPGLWRRDGEQHDQKGNQHAAITTRPLMVSRCE